MILKKLHIITFFLVSVFFFKMFQTASSYISRTSLNHHEVEYFTIINKLTINAPGEAVYQTDGANIIDPGGHLLFLKLFQKIKLSLLKELITVHDLRLISFITFTIGSLIFFFLIKTITSDKLFSFLSTSLLFLLTPISIYSVLARSFIFEFLFTLSTIYFLCTLITHQTKPIKFILFLLSYSILLWIRYPDFLISGPIIIFIFLNCIKDKKLQLLVLTTYILNFTLIFSLNYKQIINIRASISHLSPYMIGALSNKLDFKMYINNTFNRFGLIYIFSILLFLFNKSNSNNDNSYRRLFSRLFFWHLGAYLIASLLNLYPFSFSERHMIPLMVYVVTLGIIELHFLIKKFELDSLFYPISSCLLIYYLVFNFDSTIESEFNNLSCPYGIRERAEVINKSEKIYFSYLAWYEYWYHLNYGQLKYAPFNNKKLIVFPYTTKEIDPSLTGHFFLDYDLKFSNRDYRPYFNHQNCTIVKLN